MRVEKLKILFPLGSGAAAAAGSTCSLVEPGFSSGIGRIPWVPVESGFSAIWMQGRVGGVFHLFPRNPVPRDDPLENECHDRSRLTAMPNDTKSSNHDYNKFCNDYCSIVI